MVFVFFSILNCNSTRKDSRGSGGSVTTNDVANNTPKGAAYGNAHNKAGALDSRFAEPNFVEDNTGFYVTKLPYNPSIPKSLNPETLINNGFV